MRIYEGWVTLRPSGEIIPIRVRAVRFAVAANRAIRMAMQRRDHVHSGKVERIELDLVMKEKVIPTTSLNQVDYGLED